MFSGRGGERGGGGLFIGAGRSALGEGAAVPDLGTDAEVGGGSRGGGGLPLGWREAVRLGWAVAWPVGWAGPVRRKKVFFKQIFRK